MREYDAELVRKQVVKEKLKVSIRPLVLNFLAVSR